MKKPFNKMTARELAEATSEFDRPGAAEKFKALSPSERKQWNREKRGRPRKPAREKAVRVLISINPELLAAAHRQARQTGHTLSGFIAERLLAAIPKRRRSA
jgi:hypothetical protein